jgi:hypothetical protein
VTSEPLRSEGPTYPPAPDTALPRYTDDELRALLSKAEAKADANPLPFDEMMAELRARQNADATGVAEGRNAPALTDQQKQALDRRRAGMEADPSIALTWEELDESLRPFWG